MHRDPHEITGIVLGSGLGKFAERPVIRHVVSFAEAGLPASTVPGHHGSFLFGELGNMPVILMQGRLHLYEGYSPAETTAGIRWMASQGISRVILTNAAGSLNPQFAPGSWMMLSDHLNLTGVSPLMGPCFVDLTNSYDPAWRAAFRCSAMQTMKLHEGIYAGLRGPQFETPAEIHMLGLLGAHAVGMSTVLETIQARALGLRVAAFSCLTNWAAGISTMPLTHDEVLRNGQAAATSLAELLERVLSEEAPI